VGVRLLGGVWWYWFVRGPLEEGIAWAQALLAVDQANRQAGRPPTAASARALFGLATLTWRQGDFAGAIALFEDTLALWREVGDAEGIATALYGLGTAALDLDDLARAQALFEESLALARTLGDPQAIVQGLGGRDAGAPEHGEYARAETLYREVLARSLARQATLDVALTLQNLGVVCLRQGLLAPAAAKFEESLQRYRVAVAGAACCSRRRARARRDPAGGQSGAVPRGGRDVGRRIGARHPRGRGARGDSSRAAELYHESLALHRRTQARLGLVQALEGLAHVAHREGRWEDAVRLWAVALAQRVAPPCARRWERRRSPRPGRPGATWRSSRRSMR
jgi:tetratricopeptide (TPR) repeat protein